MSGCVSGLGRSCIPIGQVSGRMVHGRTIQRCGLVDSALNVRHPPRSHPQMGAVVFAPLVSVINIANDVKPFFYRFALGKSLLPPRCPTACARRLTRLLNVADRTRTGFCTCRIYAHSMGGRVHFDNCFSVLNRMLTGTHRLVARRRCGGLFNDVHPRVVRLTEGSRRC